MLLINFEQSIIWTKYCVLPLAGNENSINEYTNANNIIYPIKYTKLYFPVVTFSARAN